MVSRPTLEEKKLRRLSSCLMMLAIPLLVVTTGAALVTFSRYGKVSETPLPILLAWIGVALAGLLFWAALLLRSSTKTIGAANEIVERALAEHEGPPPPMETSAELAARLCEKLNARIDSLSNELDGFKLILSAMGDGILVVDSQRTVLFSNPAARKILGIPEEAPLARSLLQLTEQAELLANIEGSITAMQACSFEFQLPVADSNPPLKRFVQAHCAPYKNEKQALAGAVAVLHDITELRRLERMRTEFVSNVSHELRTPLMSLMGYIETLETGAIDHPEQARDFLKICSRQAEGLAHIVEDLLRLSKLENPQSEIADAVVSLNEVVNAAVEQCAIHGEKRGIKITQELPDAEVTIKGDRGLLVQCVSNLIENAVNYNRDNGSVQVILTPSKPSGDSDPGSDGSEWDVTVSDTGIGIPAHALQRVFERFYRVDKVRSRSQGGTGLGLAIVKHIALAHGASVHVESEVGKGSTFFIRFKVGKAQKVRKSGRVESQEEGERNVA